MNSIIEKNNSKKQIHKKCPKTGRFADFPFDPFKTVKSTLKRFV